MNKTTCSVEYQFTFSTQLFCTHILKIFGDLNFSSKHEEVRPELLFWSFCYGMSQSYSHSYYKSWNLLHRLVNFFFRIWMIPLPPPFAWFYTISYQFSEKNLGTIMGKFQVAAPDIKNDFKKSQKKRFSSIESTQKQRDWPNFVLY